MLPSSVKSFFRFRCKPEQFVWVYAETREQAEQRLHARMKKNYGTGWSIASKVVDEFTAPEHAAANSPGSLLQSVPEVEGREFLEDYRANERGRLEQPKLKNIVKSQLEYDIESFEKRLRQRER
ncbi:hypothetical protein Psta_0452 [Pirellula staleyi DSM 6068]|uniref:Uncharacterized protein n=1 Tax=Pirellula staleyi (strain ATCC 27377 / DSM 6068 / ICPB 4128) TaxID=530564 RepID=D2R3A9_PIRSD|nr:hypothetical protein Psta_0452 [Pirellula staleyi DSM 6068]